MPNMKNIVALFSLFFFVALPFVAGADAPPAARDILENQRNLHSTKSETATVVMLLVDKDGSKKKREMRTWSKTMPDGLVRSLMVFSAPEDLAGTALLNWELQDEQAKQWLYMPAVGKMQRVASSSKADAFMGTDFTYEDMEPDDLDQFEMTLAGSVELDGQDCHVIEVTPATEAKRQESGYSKRVLTVRKDINFTVKTEYYDPRGRLLKVQTAHDLENVQGDMWIARKTLMNNLRAKHQTLMGIVSRNVNIDIPDDTFTERFVTEGSPLQ